MNEKWIGTGHGCPTCNALNGQVHPSETWQAENLAPGCHRLICGANCNCTMLPTTQEETGSLENLPERTSMQSTATITARFLSQSNGVYEIAVITAGQAIGHPWNFPPATLEQSAHLFSNKPVYIDHEATADKKRHSARDLAGKLINPRYDSAYQGILADLSPAGPAAETIRALAQAALDNPDLDIGFSADIDLRSKNGRDVDSIISVRSADVVLSPARGGKFLRALLSKYGANLMSDETTTPAPEEADRVEQITAQMQALLHTQAEQEKQAAKLQAMEKTHIDQCAYLLTAALQASNLPEVAQKRIRAMFSGKAFTADELNQAIKDKRDEIQSYQAESTVQGFPRISAMFTAQDQLQAAVDDLFNVKRDANKVNLSVHKLTGIRELYLGLTGDLDFAGAIELSRAQFQGTTATFPALVKNAMNKAIQQAWEQYGAAGYDWWQKIVTVESFSTLNEITWIRTGTIASLPSVEEGAEYTELTIGDNAETSTFTKYGGYLGITLETLDRDDTRQLRMAPRELAKAAIRNISSLVAAIFTSNSAIGPTLADTGALFNATAVTTKGGHANLLTTALGTDYTAWDAVALAMFKQPMLISGTTYGTGAKQGIWPRYCLVPGKLATAANALFIPRWEANAQNVAAVSATWGGRVEPVVVPEWTDDTDWAATIDPMLLPGIMVGTRYGLLPQIILAGSENDPAMFTNDESRMKVRHFVAVGVADWRALHKSNVGG